MKLVEAVPPAVTTLTAPVAGNATRPVIDVSVHVSTTKPFAPAGLGNSTLPAPCVAPKFVPVIVSCAPHNALVGDTDVTVGGGGAGGALDPPQAAITQSNEMVLTGREAS
jgi:hypothetical protein